MNKAFTFKIGVILAGVLLFAISAFAMNYNPSNVGANGYDVVAYFTDSKAVRGTGWHVAVHDGTTYLFSNKKNRKMFAKSPGKYLPEFGGYCAFGAAMGKKFYADPTVWKIVDGKLYLNLDQKIQKKFEKDVPGHLKKAYANWPKIKDKAPEGI
ncbi:hypothetical protein D3OALGA1CA_1774 [Olavius algarvensis associated proteobacterium Delta 3]|nr:hypothetical protein D3OALGA1CA_1774 [Olavius algarvensis associated proteobacterium Delta 3]CAB5136867.1 hypothetical protein D3OALGB2SA_3989 [Olavius algarvensis associated proteobacterium Delta 3]